MDLREPLLPPGVYAQEWQRVYERSIAEGVRPAWARYYAKLAADALLEGRGK